jgi:hypothetical protein
MYRTEKYCGAQCVLSHAEKRVFETSNTLNPALAFTFAVATPELRHVRRDPPPVKNTQLFIRLARTIAKISAITSTLRVPGDPMGRSTHG